MTTPFGSASTGSNLFSSFATAAKSTNPFNTSSIATTEGSSKTTATPTFSFSTTKPSPFSFFSNNNKDNTDNKTPSFTFGKLSSSPTVSTSVFGSSGNTAKTASAPAATSSFSDDSNVLTGEESETVLLQSRCKLYSMPPTTLTNWKEVGIGPVRILHNPTTKQYRVVQRRESTPGGAGTKLILNVNIARKTCVVSKASLDNEKHIVLRMIQSDGIQCYLFKFKLVGDANEFLEKMDDLLKKDGDDDSEDKHNSSGATDDNDIAPDTATTTDSSDKPTDSEQD